MLVSIRAIQTSSEERKPTDFLNAAIQLSPRKIKLTTWRHKNLQ